MGIGEKATEIFIITDRTTSARIIEHLESKGLDSCHTASGRRDLLEEKKGFLKLFGSGTSILHDPVVITRFLIHPGVEKALVNWIIREENLNIPGRGTVYGRSVSVLLAHENFNINRIRDLEPAKRELLTDLMGICCISPKGEGDVIGKMGLETGTGIPAITLGVGTGFRDKIGLWRVTIPADKEIVNLVTAAHHAENAMEMMIEIGGLDQPGKGFIFLYPIQEGLVDVKAYVGLYRQAASIEQIVTVIDELKGDTRWRHREFSKYPRSGKKRKYMTDLANLTLICDEGRMTDLVKVAMRAGAGGATISKLKHVSTARPEIGKIYPPREIAEIILMKNQVMKIAAILEQNGVLGDDSHGQVFCSPIPKAYTYFENS